MGIIIDSTFSYEQKTFISSILNVYEQPVEFTPSEQLPQLTELLVVHPPQLL